MNDKIEQLIDRCDIDPETGKYVARSSAVPVYGIGESVQEAREDFVNAALDMYDDLIRAMNDGVQLYPHLEEFVKIMERVMEV